MLVRWLVNHFGARILVTMVINCFHVAAPADQSFQSVKHLNILDTFCRDSDGFQMTSHRSHLYLSLQLSHVQMKSRCVLIHFADPLTFCLATTADKTGSTGPTHDQISATNSNSIRSTLCLVLICHSQLMWITLILGLQLMIHSYQLIITCFYWSINQGYSTLINMYVTN